MNNERVIISFITFIFLERKQKDHLSLVLFLFFSTLFSLFKSLHDGNRIFSRIFVYLGKKEGDPLWRSMPVIIVSML